MDISEEIEVLNTELTNLKAQLSDLTDELTNPNLSQEQMQTKQTEIDEIKVKIAEKELEIKTKLAEQVGPPEDPVEDQEQSGQSGQPGGRKRRSSKKYKKGGNKHTMGGRKSKKCKKGGKRSSKKSRRH